MCSMTRTDIVRMAREAGFTPGPDEWVFTEMLERFAALVAAAEREACETAIEELMPDSDRGDCASAIRARSQA